MVEPISGLLIFAGSWLTKKLARDYAQKRKSEHLAVFGAATIEHDTARDACMVVQEQASSIVGRIGIQRIESMRRVLPQAARAARLCSEKGLDSSAFKDEGWFGGRSHKSLLALSASLIAVDLVLPEDAPVTSAETLLSTLAAQGAYKAFETLPHHEGADIASMAITPDDLNETMLQGVDAAEGGIGKVDDFFSHQGLAKGVAHSASTIGVQEIHHLATSAEGLMAGASALVGQGVTSAAVEVSGAMDVLGDFIGDFAGPIGWALAGWSIGSVLHGTKKIATKRQEVRLQTEQLLERAERAKRIIVRGEEIERIAPEVSYSAFKHAWILKQVTKKRFRGKDGRERDAKRAELLAKSARAYWQLMNAPVLAKGGDAADTPLTADMPVAA